VLQASQNVSHCCVAVAREDCCLDSCKKSETASTARSLRAESLADEHPEDEAEPTRASQSSLTSILECSQYCFCVWSQRNVFERATLLFLHNGHERLLLRCVLRRHKLQDP
jgi:hypothetical protein